MSTIYKAIRAMLLTITILPLILMIAINPSLDDFLSELWDE